MNSRERVISALKLKEPDRVPTFEWVIEQNIIQAICPGSSYFEFIDKMDLDAVVISADYELEKIGKNLFKDEWGVIRKKGYEEYLVPLEDRAPIRNKIDFSRYNPPDPVAKGRFDSLKKAVKLFKGKKAIVFRINDVLSKPRDLRGYSKLLMDLKLAPDFVRDLAEFSAEYHTAMALEAIKIGAEMFVTTDDYADNSGPIMSPSDFRECFLPGFRKFASNIKKSGAYFLKHTDGNIWPLLDMFVEAGIDCIDPVDPLAGMDIAEVKNKYGTKIAIKGNIDCVETLSNRSIQEVKCEVLECILKASPGGGHIISSSNSVHSGVKPDNYKAMLDTIREYGSYPIDVKHLKKEISILRSRL